MLSDIVKGGGQVLEDILTGLQKDAFAETVSTDSAADIADKQQGGGMIFMFEAWQDGVFVLLGWIELAPFIEFVDVGDDEMPDGIIGIIPVDQGQIIIVGAEAVVFFDFGELVTFGG